MEVVGNNSFFLGHWICQGRVSKYGDEAWDAPAGCPAFTSAIDKKQGGRCSSGSCARSSGQLGPV